MKLKTAIAQQCEKEYNEFLNSIKKPVVEDSDFVMPNPEEYYRKVNRILRETELDPTFYTDAVKWKKINSVDLKKTLNNDLKAAYSKTKTESAKKSSNSIQNRLKGSIGTSGFEKLRDIYESYSSFSGNANKMENHELQRLMKDYELYTNKTTKVTMELIFKRKNKHKNHSKYLVYSSNIRSIHRSSV